MITKFLEKHDVRKLAIGVFFFRILYAVSFPFFVEGDGVAYYRLMLEPFESSLIHASGYPFLFHHISTFLAWLTGSAPAHVLPFLQQIVAGACVVFFYSEFRHVVPKKWAFFLALFLGGNYISLSAAGASRPEFLQESAGILILTLLMRAWRLESLSQKKFHYVLLGALLGLTYLIKFNSIAFAGIFLCCLYDRKLPFRSRFATTGLSIAAACLVVGSFVLFFHYPSTGSYSLNLEHGWIFSKKIKAAKMQLSPQAGPATVKHFILTRELPPAKTCCSQLWSKLDSVPPEERRPYQEKYATLLKNNDMSWLQNKYRQFGSPEAFYDIPMNLYYYLGLPASEKLMRDVFFETIQNNPSQYIEHFFRMMGLAFSFARLTEPYSPILQAPGLTDWSREDCKVIQRNDPRFPNSTWLIPMKPFVKCWGGIDYYRSTYIVRPVMYFLQLSLWAFWLAPYVLLPLLLFGVVSVFLHKGPGSRTRAMLFLSVMSSYTLLGIFTALIYYFRSKEFMVGYPLVFVGATLGASMLWETVRTNASLRRLEYKRRQSIEST